MSVAAAAACIICSMAPMSAWVKSSASTWCKDRRDTPDSKDYMRQRFGQTDSVSRPLKTLDHFSPTADLKGSTLPMMAMR